MKNLGKIENKKDIAILGNITEIPYGGIITVPKHIPIPDGYIEWGTTLKAEDYPHLVDIFGTTNIILKEAKVKMTSNTSNTELYIDTVLGNNEQFGCDETFDNLWKIFDGDIENGYSAGDGEEKEGATYNRSVTFRLKGTIIDNIYNLKEQIEYYGVNYKWVQDNVGAYSNGVLSLQVAFNGASIVSSNPTERIEAGEIYQGDFTSHTFVSSISGEDRFISISGWITAAKLLEIKEMTLILPTITNETYIKIPINWDIGNNIMAVLQNKMMKYLMYVGNSIK